MDQLIKNLRAIVGRENVLDEPEELLVYECDGLPQHKHPPRAVVFPTSTEETSEVLSLLSQEGVSFAPRRSEEHTSELQSPDHLVCRLLLEKKNEKLEPITPLTAIAVA